METKTAIVRVDAESLISKAIDQKLDVATMERLLAMRTQLKEEWAREEFFKGLAAFQKETPAIKKEKQVFDKTGKVRYSYAPLEAIVNQVKDALERNHFSYTLKTSQADKTLTVVCEAHHAAGHTESTSVTVPVGSEYMTAQQVVGAAITYAKRYAFCNAFGIMTGDEDTDAVEVEVIPPPKLAPATDSKIIEWRSLWDGYKSRFTQPEIDGMKETLKGKPVDEQNQILKNALVAVKPDVGK